MGFSSTLTIARRVKANFVQKTRHTEAVQEQFYTLLLLAYRDTELGRKYRLSEIKTINFERIPVLPYSSYESYTERIAQGEKNILHLTQSSTLTSPVAPLERKKLIPVTKRFQNSLRQANLTSIGFFK